MRLWQAIALKLCICLMKPNLWKQSALYPVIVLLNVVDISSMILYHQVQRYNESGRTSECLPPGTEI
jgi:hypothetical protein